MISIGIAIIAGLFLPWQFYSLDVLDVLRQRQNVEFVVNSQTSLTVGQ